MCLMLLMVLLMFAAPVLALVAIVWAVVTASAKLSGQLRGEKGPPDGSAGVAGAEPRFARVDQITEGESEAQKRFATRIAVTLVSMLVIFLAILIIRFHTT